MTDLDDIERLKYRYLRALDGKDWDTFGQTLTEDVEASYGAELRFTGRAAVVAYMTENLGPGIVSVHHCHHPEIEVSGDEATGHWALQDTVIAAEFRFALRGAALYTDHYRRCSDGLWRIARTGYRRLYEATFSLDDLPSLKFTALS
jgi:ketosteroid isomerase-like protein